MDAIAMLHEERLGAKKLMEEIARNSGAKKLKLFTTLKGDLSMHAKIEEDVFYPALKTHARTTAFRAQGREAHAIVEASLAQLAQMPVDDPDWDPNFTSMQKILLRHVADEEQNIFPKVREALSAEELLMLGVKMRVEKDSLLKEAQST